MPLIESLKLTQPAKTVSSFNVSKKESKRKEPLTCKQIKPEPLTQNTINAQHQQLSIQQTQQKEEASQEYHKFLGQLHDKEIVKIFGHLFQFTGSVNQTNFEGAVKGKMSDFFSKTVDIYQHCCTKPNSLKKINSLAKQLKFDATRNKELLNLFNSRYSVSSDEFKNKIDQLSLKLENEIRNNLINNGTFSFSVSWVSSDGSGGYSGHVFEVDAKIVNDNVELTYNNMGEGAILGGHENVGNDKIKPKVFSFHKSKLFGSGFTKYCTHITKTAVKPQSLKNAVSKVYGSPLNLLNAKTAKTDKTSRKQKGSFCSRIVGSKIAKSNLGADYSAFKLFMLKGAISEFFKRFSSDRFKNLVNQRLTHLCKKHGLEPITVKELMSNLKTSFIKSYSQDAEVMASKLNVANTTDIPLEEIISFKSFWNYLADIIITRNENDYTVFSNQKDVSVTDKNIFLELFRPFLETITIIQELTLDNTTIKKMFLEEKIENLKLEAESNNKSG